ncbi:MAG: tetratricopeptide repeat protein [Planctomycetes bacterium]|nr:tetratricopeptide repeat protein [Planctomycetota bacterium]
MPIPLYKNGSPALRLILYPGGLLAVSLLTWLGWFHQPEASDEQRLSSADMLVKIGAFDSARAEVEAVLKHEPDDLHALLLLGLLEERQDRTDAAIGVYERARRRTDDENLRRDIDLSLVDLERRAGRLDGARLRLAAFEREHGADRDSGRLAGLVDWDDGDHAAAITRFEALVASGPEDLAIGLLLVGAYIEEGRAADARLVLDRMPATDRRAGGSWKDLARLYLESGDEESAVAALGRYVELDGNAAKRLAQDEFWSSLKEHPLVGRLIGG